MTGDATPTGGTPDRYLVAGHPVAHSQSPFIHTAFARATGETISYDRLLIPLDDFPASMTKLAASGVRGCNVTVPFKFEACRLAARPSARAMLAGAANVLRFDPDGWSADNTDGIGLVRDIELNAGCRLAGRRVLLIGAGGAAAGALGPLLEARPAELTVANRTPEKAAALVERHRPAAHPTTRLRAATLGDCGRGFDVIVNASSSSLQGGAPPVASDTLAPGALVVDMMYGAPARRFLDWAEAHGARSRDGLGMLVEQAAAAFEFWRGGRRPATADVLAALRARLAAATER